MEKAEKEQLIRAIKKLGVRLKFGMGDSAVSYTNDPEDRMQTEGYAKYLQEITHRDWIMTAYVYRFDVKGFWSSSDEGRPSEVITSLGCNILAAASNEIAACMYFEVDRPLPTLPAYIEPTDFRITHLEKQTNESK